MRLFSRKKTELEVPMAPPELPELEETEPEEKEGLIELPKEKREEEMQERPLFIDMNSFKDVVDELGAIKKVLREEDDSIARIEEFSHGEDNELKRWHDIIIQIQKNLIYCEKILSR